MIAGTGNRHFGPGRREQAARERRRPILPENFLKRSRLGRADRRSSSSPSMTSTKATRCRGLSHGHDAHVPVRRVSVRPQDRRRPARAATAPLKMYEVREQDGKIEVRL